MRIEMKPELARLTEVVFINEVTFTRNIRRRKYASIIFTRTICGKYVRERNVSLSIGSGNLSLRIFAEREETRRQKMSYLAISAMY
jgi:hypothetical protein